MARASRARALDDHGAMPLTDDLTRANRRQDIVLKRRYAVWLLWVLVG